VITVDCDVDAANLALLLPGQVVRMEPFWSGRRARITLERCTLCGLCVDHCRASAIHMEDSARIDPLACEGCGVCALVCPMDAVQFDDNQAGRWMERRTACGPMIHAELGIAQDNSGKLVAHVREQARAVAERDDIELILVDGPPGIGCPVHASVTGCDLAVVVTEPTPSGQHDLERVLDLLEHFRLPGVVLINKHDLSPSITARIESMAGRRNAPVVGAIPFRPEVPRALARGELPMVIDDVASPLTDAWKRILDHLARGSSGLREPLSGRDPSGRSSGPSSPRS
jgi:MinD superfamily P-loop ATPase